MNTLTKWLIVSVIAGIAGVAGVSYIEDVAGISGELNRGVLLLGIVGVFLLIVFSLFGLVKANADKAKKKIIPSVLFSLILLNALAVNGVVFIVYFVGK